MLGDDIDLARFHDLSDGRQACLLARLREEAQGLNAEPLEGIGAGSRLEGAAPQDRRACAGDAAGGLEHHLPALDGARPGHDGEVAVAHSGAQHLDHGVLGVRLARGQLERAGDRRHRLDAGHHGQFAHEKVPHRSHIAQDRDHDPLGAVVVMGRQVVRAEVVAYVRGFLLRRAHRHHDDHGAVLLMGACRRGSWSGNKKAEAMPLLVPDTTHDPGSRLRERSCRVAVKVEDAFHGSSATLTGAGRGVKSKSALQRRRGDRRFRFLTAVLR